MTQKPSQSNFAFASQAYGIPVKRQPLDVPTAFGVFGDEKKAITRSGYPQKQARAVYSGAVELQASIDHEMTGHHWAALVMYGAANQLQNIPAPLRNCSASSLLIAADQIASGQTLKPVLPIPAVMSELAPKRQARRLRGYAQLVKDNRTIVDAAMEMPLILGV